MPHVLVRDDSANFVEFSPEVTAWLQEATRRHAPETPATPAESSETVLAYLESLLGRRLRSRTDVNRCLEELISDEGSRRRQADRQRLRREAMLLGLLAVSYLHYFFWEVHLRIAAVPQTYYFAPAKSNEKT